MRRTTAEILSTLEEVLATLRRLSWGKLYSLFVLWVSAPIILSEYFSSETGSEYGVGLMEKLVLGAKIMRNKRRIETGSTVLEHLVIATKVLTIPRDTEGCIVECGCYKGGSTANLSLVASLCGRRLEVFDSFEGMPEPSEQDRAHVRVVSEEVYTYDEDAWSGSLQEVRRTVSQYGDASVCNFHVGYFDDTLPEFDEPCSLVFLDVGLRESAETCLEHLWPLLGSGGYLFTHDVQHMEIATLYFDADWWEENVGAAPPSVIGAGNGLGLHPTENGFTSLLGYIIKDPRTTEFEEVAEKGARVE